LSTRALWQPSVLSGSPVSRDISDSPQYWLVFCQQRHFWQAPVLLIIYKTIIIPAVLYEYETWFLTLREEHRMKVSENRVLRIIFGPKRDKVTGEWKKLHNEELRNL
jgi:hypothetical protein